MTDEKKPDPKQNQKKNADHVLSNNKEKDNQSGDKRDNESNSDLHEKKLTKNNSVESQKPTIKNKNGTTQKENLFSAKPIPKMESTKSSKISLSAITIFLLLAILFSVSGWVFYQQQQTSQSLESIKSKIQNDIDLQNNSVNQAIELNAKTSENIEQLKQGLRSLATNNNDLKLQLLSAQEKIKALSGRKKQDWMLAEVEYLIDIAALKLTLQNDRNTAIQLLKTADERLIEISDRSLVPIREAIARDVSNLNLIQESDITGVVITLDALAQQVSKLELLALSFDETLLGTKLDTTEVNDVTNQGESDSFWSGLSKVYYRFIEEFIVIKEHAETPQPLMTPDQRGNLNQNIQLALQQVQIAAIQGNESLYQLNLKKAINWITHYFGEGTEPASIIKELKLLENEKIDVRYPSQLESSTAIELVTKNQLYNWLDNNFVSPSIEEKNQQQETLEAIKQ